MSTVFKNLLSKHSNNLLSLSGPTLAWKFLNAVSGILRSREWKNVFAGEMTETQIHVFRHTCDR